MYQEGAFDTTRDSLLILVSGINRFRRLEKEDMAEAAKEIEAKNRDPENNL